MINMPLILLTILFLFNELVQVGRRRHPVEGALAIALGAMTVGLMQAVNTWDWPSMMLFALIGLGYVWGLRWQPSFRPIHDLPFYSIALAVLGFFVLAITLLLVQVPPYSTSPSPALLNALESIRLLILGGIALIVLWIACRYLLVRASAIDLLGQLGGFLILSFAFALPHSTWYATSYNSLALWDGGKTPLWAYFDIHGLFLFLVISLLVWESGRWLRAVRVKSLQGRAAAAKKAGIGGGLFGLFTLVLGLAGYQVALVVLPLTAWIALLFFRPQQPRAMRFMLVLIGLALAMTLGVEIIVVGGDIGRQNTVFKFYIQVWLLLSVAGGVAAGCLLRAAGGWDDRLRLLWYSLCALLFFIAGLYPLMATRARSLDRMVPNLPLTLNGLDYMQHALHYEIRPSEDEYGELDEGELIDMRVDYELMRWLQENVRGTPVIMEGRAYPSEYQWNGRFSVTTGLPTPLGWNFHQRQQRTFEPLPRWVDQRERNINVFYNTANIDSAVDMLHHYDVQYIIRSGLETVHYSSEGLEKFDKMVQRGLLSVAYAAPGSPANEMTGELAGGIIYQVDAEAVQQYLMERNS